MKTQLLEDIGESAALPPPLSSTGGHSTAGKGAPSVAPAPAPTAPPPRARTATGVWRQRLAEEPPAPAPQPAEEVAPRELDKVFGELAALEAQFVRAEPAQLQPATPAESLHPPGIALAEQTTVSNPIHATATPHDHFFDFTPPAPAAQVANPFTPAPIVLAQSRKRPLVWAACALSAALLAWGARYLVQERTDDGSLALVASQAKEPMPPAVPASPPLPDVPPLVMLEPDPPAAVTPEPAARLAAGRGALVAAPKIVRTAKPVPAAPAKQASIRKTRERPEAVAAPAKEKRPRQPVRQLARAPVVVTQKPLAPDTSMAATLKACREHGYHASQCIKRQCSVGPYGFACRGR